MRRSWRGPASTGTVKTGTIEVLQLCRQQQRGTDREGRKMIRGILGIAGLAVALAGGIVLLSGGALFVADSVLTDADGFYAIPPAYVGFDTYAITGNAEGVSAELPWFLERRELASLRISAEPHGEDAETFIGIASPAAIDAYLADVLHHELTSLTDDPEQLDVIVHEGEAEPALPSEQAFWFSSTVEYGEPLIWTVGEGDVGFVVMNSDGSRGVEAVVSIGVQIPLLQTTGVALLVGGGVTALIGTLMFAAAF